MESFLAKYDKTRDRHSDESELRVAFGELGARFPNQRAGCALASADKDMDGHISFSELGDLLSYVIQQGYKIK
ncbi:hypothetical protein CRG98_037484 [Punica granatum]|uniref:EF-hand domain-containing protein n=1 Tax=Punica granatum TaxID=22663 RepID=A0A2I0IDH5_PUNGR|nr:hypothetical protein CRG98_037484 [Punica granatum]